jgi:putative peptide zinc metalloprotease protein
MTESLEAVLLPPLREDLELIASGRSTDGAPLYTIHDPLTGKFFRIGWLEFECISRWHLGNVGALFEDLQKRFYNAVPIQDVFALISFVKAQQLVRINTSEGVDGLVKMHKAKQHGPFQWLLHNYLYLKVPLVRPDAFLAWLLARIRPLVGVLGALILAALMLSAATVIIRNWTAWIAEFSVLKTPDGLLLAAMTLTFAKIVHEIGHGLLAKKFGCHVPRMGVAFIVMLPVLWTDTTQAWRLDKRWQKVLIDSGGILAEMMLASIATLLWLITPDGTLKSAFHILSGISWIMTLGINASPFMRFDGYYIASDLVDIPNLQPRSFAYTRWWIRRMIFATDEPPPELFPHRQRPFLIVYAFICWIYRLILFTGIAFVVYHHFFKALGIFLFAVEIWYFILKPIVNEFKNWAKTLEKSALRPGSKIVLGFIGGLLLLYCLPLHRGVQAPALVHAKQEFLVEAPVSAQIQTMPVKNGDSVKAGDVIATLKAPDVEAKITKLQSDIASLRAQHSGLAVEQFQRSQIVNDVLIGKISELRAQNAIQEKLVVKAPADGVISDIPLDLHPGTWVDSREPLGILVAGEPRIDAFVTQNQLERLQLEDNARLITDTGSALKGHRFEVVNIERTPIAEIPYHELSSNEGGPIRTRSHAQGGTSQDAMIPVDQLFRVTLLSDKPIQAGTLFRATPVTVVINGNFYSPALSFAKRVVGILIRESNL